MRFVAKAMLIYQGRRVRAGEEFDAPDTYKSKAAVKKAEYVAPKITSAPEPTTFSELARQSRGPVDFKKPKKEDKGEVV